MSKLILKKFDLFLLGNRFFFYLNCLIRNLFNNVRDLTCWLKKQSLVPAVLFFGIINRGFKELVPNSGLHFKLMVMEHLLVFFDNLQSSVFVVINLILACLRWFSFLAELPKDDGEEKLGKKANHEA